MLKRTRLFAHDEFELCNVGDMVQLQKSRPLSKKKSHIVAAITRREDGSEPPTPFPNVRFARDSTIEDAEIARQAAGLEAGLKGPGVEGKQKQL